ncbi:MAG: M48 family metalloprotease [Armatimonadota bacterium]|nr:M48 family metalloprotease [Armatimonadota bacterium]
MSKLRVLWLLALALSLMVLPVSTILAKPSDDDANEIKMGQESAAEIEKEAKLIKDPALQERIDKIGKTIAAVASNVQIPATYGNSRISKFDYTFKIIDDKEVNAFCLPAGRVYVNKGLLDFVQSDHELAGVLAHEIVHASHHHMLALLNEQSKLNNKLALVLLAALLGKAPSRDLGNLVIGAQLVQIAKMSAYGQEAEADADRVAVDYLARTPYNPVGMLTFIERLSSKTELYENNLGFLQTHPSTGDRRAIIIGELKELKIPINRRQVTNAQKAIVTTRMIDGKEIIELNIEDKILMRVAEGEDGQPARDRAEEIANRINKLLDSNVQLREVKTKDGEPIVWAKEKPLLRVTEDDATLSASTPTQVAKSAADIIKDVIWRQMVDLTMSPTSTKNLKQPTPK